MLAPLGCGNRDGDPVRLRVYYGSRGLTAWLQSQGYVVNRKRVAGLMRVMGIEAELHEAETEPASGRAQDLSLSDEKVEDRAAHQVWCADIIYIPMAQ